MSARIEAAAKAIDAVEYEPGDNAMAARMATDPALYAFRVAQARAAIEAADAVSLANGAEVDLMQLTSCCLLGSQAAAALAGLAGQNALFKTVLCDVLGLKVAQEELRHLDMGIGTQTPNAAWLRARAALQEPPDAV